MAVTIYGTEWSTPTWGLPGVPVGGIGTGDVMTYAPWPLPGSVQATYLNKCVDGITGQWHFWETFFQDRTGVYYQQSGGLQFDSATYKVETIVHQREQN